MLPKHPITLNLIPSVSLIYDTNKYKTNTF